MVSGDSARAVAPGAGPAVGGGPGAAADTSGTPRGSSGSVVSDSTGAAVDSAAARVPGKIRRLFPWTRASLPTGAVLLGPTGFSIPGTVPDRAADATVREVLEWSGGLSRIPGAGANLPDPIDFGDLPGREAPAYLIEGMPLAPPGYPETTPDPAGPIWLERIALLPADPLLLPSNPSGGVLVALDLWRPDSARSVSGARLTSGLNDVYTEEFFLARPSGSQLIRFGYADSKTAGRYGQEYFRQFGENLLLRVDRGAAWGGWRLGWRQATTRVRPDPTARYLHDRSTLEGGAAVRRSDWAADLALAMNWERLAWEGAVPAKRKESLGRALLRIEGHGVRLRPLLTLQLDRQRRRFFQPVWPYQSEDRIDLGPGLAGGVEAVSGSWQLRTSAGWSTPAPGKSGWVAALTATRSLPGGWGLRLHADRCVRAALLPRLADALGDAVGQGAFFSGSYPGNLRLLVDSGRRLETPARLEAALDGVAPRARWSLLARGVRIDHAVAPGRGELTRFTPEGYLFLSAASLDRTVQAASLRGTAAVDLGRGLALDLQVAGRTARPAVEDQLWMTPWDGRVRLSLRGALFSGDLRGEAFVRGALSGRRSTPYGVLPSGDRYDAGVSVQVDRLALSATLFNLESDLSPAADHEIGDATAPYWQLLPLRSYRLGLTWRFWD